MHVFKTFKDKSNKAIVWHDKRSCVFSPINRYMNLVGFFFKNGILHNGVYPFVRLKPFFILGVSRGRIKLKKRYHIHTPTKTRINTLSLVIGYYHVLSRRHFAGIFSFFCLQDVSCLYATEETRGNCMLFTWRCYKYLIMNTILQGDMAYICKFVFNRSGSDGDTSDGDW